MIDHVTAAALRLAGLAGLIMCVILWAGVKRWRERPVVFWLCTTATGLCVMLYVAGAFADADAGVRGLLPAWP